MICDAVIVVESALIRARGVRLVDVVVEVEECKVPCVLAKA